LSAEERDLMRADMLRERLKTVGRPIVKRFGPPGTGLDKLANS
jgi:hypothetical protein